MPFFTYDQNNSGGSFDHQPKQGIGYLVCVEAASAADADRKAEAIGLYFNGCAVGMDCECCGDRWYPAYGDGDETPLQYGSPIKGERGFPSYIHYADGRVEAVGEAKS